MAPPEVDPRAADTPAPPRDVRPDRGPRRLADSREGAVVMVTEGDADDSQRGEGGEAAQRPLDEARDDAESGGSILLRAGSENG